MRDVYYQPDFVVLHAHPDPADCMDLDGYRHAAAIRSIPGTPHRDLETPWGYGGPIGASDHLLRSGLSAWRKRQAAAGHVAEFIRIHPLMDATTLHGQLDFLQLDRQTVIVDLTQPASDRWNRYSKGTRYSIRQALARLRIRTLASDEWIIFRNCYEAGLQRNQAGRSYFLPEHVYQRLVTASWATTWIAELDGEAVAVACFLHAGRLAHYHLSGGAETGRKTFAHYGLLETAMSHFVERGVHLLHLGGGRTRDANDALLAFKARFSPHRLPFYVAGMVHDRTAYDRLGGGANGRFLGYRFQAETTRADSSAMT